MVLAAPESNIFASFLLPYTNQRLNSQLFVGNKCNFIIQSAVGYEPLGVVLIKLA